MIWPHVGRAVPAGLRPLARRGIVRARHRGLSANDAMLVSYPKSGSTWLRFLLGHVLTGEEPDYGSIRTIVPPLGQQAQGRPTLPGGGRLVRSHEPLKSLHAPDAMPVLYLLRDPRDVCRSYFNHRRRQGHRGDFPSFVDAFLRGRVDGFGSWAHHIDAALLCEERAVRPFRRVSYEALRADPAGTLSEIMDLLGVRTDPATLSDAIAANTKERMRAKEDQAFLERVRMDTTGLPAEQRPWGELVPAELDRRFREVCDPRMVAVGQSLPAQ